MITLKLRPYRKGRVWIGELPDLRYRVAEVVERTLAAESSPITKVRRAAVELFLPKGGRALYGLLGGEFISSDNGQLVIQVAISAGDEQIFTWSLAAQVDEVYIGLPREYHEGVLDGASSAEELRLLGSGVLSFHCAAHGHIGSSLSLFRQLSNAVVRLLGSNIELASEEELVALLQLQHL